MKENFYTGKFWTLKLETLNFSLNCIDWHLLQAPSEESLTKSEVIRGRFIGDPSYEVKFMYWVKCPKTVLQYEHVNVERIGEGEDAHDEETVFTIKVSLTFCDFLVTSVLGRRTPSCSCL